MGMTVRIDGQLGCFTEPWYRAERSSYPIPPPTVAAGILEAVHYHPGMAYHVNAIGLCRLPRWKSITTNEMRNKGTWRRVPNFVHDRVQRHSMVLAEPSFIVHFSIDTSNYGKHADQLRRRIERRQSYYLPCMGMSDFPIDTIRLATDEDLDAVVDYSEEIGPMPLSWQMTDRGREYELFHAVVAHGWMKVPAQPRRYG